MTKLVLSGFHINVETCIVYDTLFDVLSLGTALASSKDDTCCACGNCVLVNILTEVICESKLHCLAGPCCACTSCIPVVNVNCLPALAVGEVNSCAVTCCRCSLCGSCLCGSCLCRSCLCRCSLCGSCVNRNIRTCCNLNESLCAVKTNSYCRTVSINCYGSVGAAVHCITLKVEVTLIPCIVCGNLEIVRTSCNVGKYFLIDTLVCVPCHLVVCVSRIPVGTAKLRCTSNNVNLAISESR